MHLNKKIATTVAVLLIVMAIALRFSENAAPRNTTKVDSPQPPTQTTDSVTSSAPRELPRPADPDPEALTSSADIITKIKTALGRSGSRHAYATFSKLAEMVDAKNVREVMAYVQTLSKPQEKR